jgi:hypothetical protein
MIDMSCRVILSSCEVWRGGVNGDGGVCVDRLEEGALLAAAGPVGEPQKDSMYSPHYLLMPMASLHCRSYWR